MTIYLDYVFIENLLIDYILLKETSYISKKNIKNIKAIISAIVASLYVVIMLYLKVQVLNFFICKILLAVVIIYITFNPKELTEYIKLMGVFFLISVINVGTITFITNFLNLQDINGLLKIIVYVASLVISKFFMNYMWKIYSQNIKNNELIYEVKIALGNKSYKYNAFLDTGNSVYSYTYNLPVIFAELLEETMINELNEKEYFNITAITLSNESSKKAYVFDRVEITQKEKKWTVKAAIVFEKTKLSKDGSYNMLLNYNLYTQSLGGIKI